MKKARRKADVRAVQWDRSPAPSSVNSDGQMSHSCWHGGKGCIFGGSGIGKTSLLWSLNATTTLFMDLEAGDLAIEGWQGDTIRLRTWMDCRDFAVFIGGANPALRDDQAYSPAQIAPDRVVRPPCQQE